MRFTFLLVLLFLCFQSIAGVEEELKQWRGSSAFQGASWSFAVLDPDSHELLFSDDPFRLVTPASVTKLVSTATALNVLGPDFKFTTSLYYSGSIDSGVLTGDLFLSGTGDPSLGSARFGGYPDVDAVLQSWTESIQQAGIQQIDGRIIIDDQLYGSSSIPGSWAWQDLGNYYATGVGMVNLNENKVEISFSSAGEGTLTKLLSVKPQLTDIEWVNEVKAGATGTGDNAYIYGAPNQMVRYIRGTIPPFQKSFTIKASVPDPESFVGSSLLLALEKADIELIHGIALWSDLTESEKKDLPGIELLKLESPPLSTLVQLTNYYSLNMYAEAFLLKARKEAGDKDDAFPLEQDWLSQYWKKNVPEGGDFYLFDGSGLSRVNALSAHFLTHLLAYMQDTEVADTYFNSLPIAGESGTLRSLCKGQSCAGKVRAKSGTMNRVRSYAGYIQGQDGRWYPFAIMVNNFSGYSSSVRSRISDLLEELGTELGR